MTKTYLSQRMTKPTNWHVRRAKTQSDQSLRCLHEEKEVKTRKYFFFFFFFFFCFVLVLIFWLLFFCCCFLFVREMKNKINTFLLKMAYLELWINGVLLMYTLVGASNAANFITAYENQDSRFLIRSVFYVSRNNLFDV